MEENIFKPTIEEGRFEPTKSYNIHNLFYVAFFGGILATIILSARNAKWLKISKESFNLLLVFGIGLFIIEIFISSSVLNNLIVFSGPNDRRYLRWAFRLLALLLYFVYFQMMKQSYRKHSMLGGQNEPLLKDAIIVIIIAVIIEVILVSIGKAALSYVI